MNSTQHLAGGRPMTIQRHRVQASEEIEIHNTPFCKEWICSRNKDGQHGCETQEQSDTPVFANDMCALDEWPSHARRNREQLENETYGQKKKGRGVLKGIKKSKKHYARLYCSLGIVP